MKYYSLLVDLSQSPSGALVLLFFSAVLFSLMGVYAKTVAMKGIPSYEIVLFRSCGQAIIVLFPLAWILKVPLIPPKGVRLRIAFRGIFGGIGLQCYYKAITCLPLGDAITLSSIYPALTVLIAIPVLGEKLTIIKSAVILLSIAGAVCIAQPRFLYSAELQAETDSGSSNCEHLGYIAAAGGSVCGALVMIIIRMVGTEGHTLQLIFSWFVFGSSGSLILVLLNGDWFFPMGEAWIDILILTLIASVGHYLFNHAGRFCPAGIGSIVRSTDVMWAYLWEIGVFKVKPNFLAITGAILVFSSVVIIGLTKEDEFNEHKDEGFIKLVNKEDEHERKSESPQQMKSTRVPIVFTELTEVQNLLSLEKNKIEQ